MKSLIIAAAAALLSCDASLPGPRDLADGSPDAMARLPLDPPSIRPWPATPDGAVLSMAESGGRVYLGGRFTSLAGPPLGNGLDLELLTGRLGASRSPGAHRFDREITAVASDGTAGFYVAHLTDTGARVVHVQSDGTLGAFSVETNGRVKALLRDGDRLYVGGAFSQIIQGTVRQTRGGLAALRSDGSLEGWNPDLKKPDGSPGQARALAIMADGSGVRRLYLGGDFSLVNSTPNAGLGVAAMPYVAAFYAQDHLPFRRGDLDADWRIGPNAPVNALASDGSFLIMGGAFTRLTACPDATERPVRRLARVLPDGASGCLGWKPEVRDGEVTALAVDHLTGGQPNGVYVTGSFTGIGLCKSETFAGGYRCNGPSVDPVSGLAYLDMDATDWLPGNEQGTAGNTFMTARKTRGDGPRTDGEVVRWSPPVLTRGDGSPAVVRDLQLVGGDGDRRATLYIAGDFAAPRAGVLSLDVSDGISPRLGRFWPRLRGATVNRIAAGAGRLFVGGVIASSASGPFLAAVDVGTGALAEDFDPLADGEVHALRLTRDGGHLFAGGLFSTLGGAESQHLALLNTATGTAAAGFRQDRRGDVRFLALNHRDDRLYLLEEEGGLTHTEGLAVRSVAGSFSATPLPGWSPPAPAATRCFEVGAMDDVVYVGADDVGGGLDPGTKLFVYDATTGARLLGTELQQVHSLGAPVLSVSSERIGADEIVYLGGGFRQLRLGVRADDAVVSMAGVARFKNGALDPTFKVNGVIASGASLAGGDATTVSLRAVRGLLRRGDTLFALSDLHSGPSFVPLLDAAGSYGPENYDVGRAAPRALIIALDASTGQWDAGWDLHAVGTAGANATYPVLGRSGSTVLIGHDLSTVGSPAVARPYFVAFD